MRGHIILQTNHKLYLFMVSVSIVSCLRGSTATEILATVRAKLNGADVTELTTYDEAGNPQTDPACTTNTITNDSLQLTLTFEEGSPTCGIEQVSDSVFLRDRLCSIFSGAGKFCLAHWAETANTRH